GDCFDDDFVSDTPNSDEANYNCDVGHISCGSVDMVQNYMDYSDDVCMNLFTMGQKTRMRAQFDVGAFRESILYSTALNPALDCNVVYLTIDFDDYPGDISWEILDSNSTIIDTGGSYTNALANQSIELDFCLTDADYTFKINDSYGDGLCCNEGAGGYILETQYDTLIFSNGQFGSGETNPFSLEDQYYRFIGPGTDWNIASNWNKLSVPSECYENKLFIESDCNLYESLDLSSVMDLEIKNGATFRIED
ncbi:MAG: M43 family zinc metalloprotease, partial [Bacteroidota bacterium]